jgi:hypothetical protein
VGIQTPPRLARPAESPGNPAQPVGDNLARPLRVDPDDVNGEKSRVSDSGHEVK